MTDYTIIIPARLASSRLSEKLLQFIGDKTVLEHSYLIAKQSQAKRVVIAADDTKLVQAAKAFGAQVYAQVYLTAKTHQSGTDRLAECVALMDLPDDEIIVNLQADEPFMPAKLIDLCADTLAKDNTVGVSTVAARFSRPQDITNPNVVKVVINQRGHALYFSRAGIPFNRDNIDLTVAQYYFHHLGIYAYRAGFLKHLDHGDNIAVAIVNEKPPKGIDTQEDLQAARAYFSRQ